MARMREVKVEIVGDSRDFQRAAKDAGKEAQGFAAKLEGAVGAKLDNVAKKIPVVGGLLDKFGISAGAMGGAVVAGAVAAGAAITAFAVKGVADFQNLALEAGRFSDAAGISVEDASRWIEVAGDIGVGTEQIEAAIKKMNQSIGSGRLDDFADSVVRAKDGSIDASATFQRLVGHIGAIEDPTKRAEAAQRAFGRGYGQIAELMEMDAKDLKAALEGVSDAKVIDEKELRQAREFRAALDNLKDRSEDLALSIGGALVPVLTEVVGWFDKTVGAAKRANDAWSAVEGWVDNLRADIPGIGYWDRFLDTNLVGEYDLKMRGVAEALDIAGSEARGMGERVDRLKTQMGGAATATDGLARNTWNASRAAADLKGAYDRLLGRLDSREAMINMGNDFAALKAKAAEAFDAASSGAEDAKAKSDAYTLANIALQKEVVNYKDKLGQLPIAKVTQITTLIDQGNLDRAEAILRVLTRNRTMNIDIQTRGGAGYGGRDGVPFADGGPIPGPRGQAVPITAHGGEFVLSANVVDAIRLGRPTSGITAGVAPVAASMGGSVIVNVQVAGTVVSERSLVDAVHEGLLVKQRSGATLGFRS